MNHIEQVQYKVALIVSWYWQGTSCEKLYDELGWESLSQRRWSRRLTMYYKITNGMSPLYLSDHIPGNSTINFSLHNKIVRPPRSRMERYDNSFFPFCINNWNKLVDTIKLAPSLKDFQSNLCKFVCPKWNTFYTIRDKFGIKLLPKIKVSFSDLRDHDSITTSTA